MQYVICLIEKFLAGAFLMGAVIGAAIGLAWLIVTKFPSFTLPKLMEKVFTIFTIVALTVSFIYVAYTLGEEALKSLGFCHR